jgi:riboflavin kinase/FMN adenylyltransferase
MNKTSVALGTFDGLHRGHLKIIENAVSLAEKNGFEPVVMLFDVHPQAVLRGVAPPKLIPDDIRESILRSMGIKSIVFDFRELSSLSAEEFFDKILVGRLNAGALCCGENYRFAKNASGNTDILKELCEKSGVLLKVCELETVCGEVVSSTKIRSFVQNGEIEKANEMLGRFFCYRSPVVSGKHLGRRLGIPTINQQFESGFVEPKRGVYASFTVIDGKRYKSVTNIGVRPTVEKNGRLNSETFIIDFDGNIYGNNPTVELVSFIREERVFSSVEELKKQIERDINKR